jgi:predicted ferric reductase
VLKRSRVRAYFFFIHGVLSLLAGGTLFYLRRLSSNPFFSAIAVVIALVLCGAALGLAGVADWFAAMETSRRSLQQILLYTLAGLSFVAAGAFLGFTASGTLHILLLLTVAHGLLFGALALGAAFRMRQIHWNSMLMGAFGVASILLAGWIAGLVHTMDDRSALGWVGGYLCLVGLKLFFFAGEERYLALHAGRTAAADGIS